MLAEEYVKWNEKRFKDKLFTNEMENQVMKLAAYLKEEIQMHKFLNQT